MEEHPDITSAERTGHPCNAAPENRDSPNARLEFAEEHINEFIAFALAGDADILDGFAEHYRWKYKNWLN